MTMETQRHMTEFYDTLIKFHSPLPLIGGSRRDPTDAVIALFYYFGRANLLCCSRTDHSHLHISPPCLLGAY